MSASITRDGVTTYVPSLTAEVTPTGRTATSTGCNSCGPHARTTVREVLNSNGIPGDDIRCDLCRRSWRCGGLGSVFFREYLAAVKVPAAEWEQESLFDDGLVPA